MRNPLLRIALLAIVTAACAHPYPQPDGPVDPPPPADPAPAVEKAKPSDDALFEPLPMEWLSIQGTSIVGFGILRLVPPSGAKARYRIRYSDSPDGYGVTDNAQIFVLPGDAFADREMVYGHDLIAFAFDPGENPDLPPPENRRGGYYDDYPQDGYAPTLHLDVEIEAAEEATFLVAYGPWTDPDTGRPPGDRHTFNLTVTPITDDAGRRGQYDWIESEAGELISSNWSHRPELARGDRIAASAFFGRRPPFPAVHLEIRPLILYDARLVRASDEPLDAHMPGVPTPGELRAEARILEQSGEAVLAAGRRERAADLEALAERRDRRIVMTPTLAEKFRRVPIRWR